MEEPLKTPKTLIVCTSVSHGNTRKVANAMAPILGARVVAPEEAAPDGLADYDLVGFGSGIFNRAFHPALRSFVERLPAGRVSGRAFVFVTSGFSKPSFAPMERLLDQKGYGTVDTFSCRGWDTFLPFQPFGGIRKGRPDANDLDLARAFAEDLRGRVATP